MAETIDLITPPESPATVPNDRELFSPIPFCGVKRSRAQQRSDREQRVKDQIDQDLKGGVCAQRLPEPDSPWEEESEEEKDDKESKEEMECQKVDKEAQDLNYSLRVVVQRSIRRFLIKSKRTSDVLCRVKHDIYFSAGAAARAEVGLAIRRNCSLAEDPELTDDENDIDDNPNSFKVRKLEYPGVQEPSSD